MRQHDDRIGETSTTTGTVPFVLAGAIVGHRTFGSVSADGEKRVYHADDENGNWEVGLGIYNASANTFRAATSADVWASSNGGNLVDFPSGIKHIVHGQSAEEVPFVRNPGDPRWQVPAADGANNQLLATDGNGQLKWADPIGLDAIDLSEVNPTGSNQPLILLSDKVGGGFSSGLLRQGGGEFMNLVGTSPGSTIVGGCVAGDANRRARITADGTARLLALLLGPHAETGAEDAWVSRFGASEVRIGIGGLTATNTGIRIDTTTSSTESRVSVWLSGGSRRLKAGPNGSGPGGTGRALFIDNT